MKRRSAEAGFTLTELMIVVVLVGILVAIGAASTRTTVDLRTTTQRTGDYLREASRQASKAGPVPPPALAAGETSQVRLHVFTDVSSGSQIVSLEVFSDPGSGFAWNGIQAFSLPVKARLAGYRTTADVSGGLGPETTLGPSDELFIECRPSGTYNASTLYFQHDTEQLRLVTMPLHGSPSIFGGW